MSAETSRMAKFSAAALTSDLKNQLSWTARPLMSGQTGSELDMRGVLPYGALVGSHVVLENYRLILVTLELALSISRARLYAV